MMSEEETALSAADAIDSSLQSGPGKVHIHHTLQCPFSVQLESFCVYTLEGHLCV